MIYHGVKTQPFELHSIGHTKKNPAEAQTLYVEATDAKIWITLKCS